MTELNSLLPTSRAHTDRIDDAGYLLDWCLRADIDRVVLYGPQQLRYLLLDWQRLVRALSAEVDFLRLLQAVTPVEQGKEPPDGTNQS